MLVFIPDETLHDAVDFVGVDGNVRFYAAWVVLAVGCNVARLLHVLGGEPGQSLRTGRDGGVQCSAYLDLLQIPCVHAQGLYLGDVRTELAVGGGAS